MPSKKKQSGEIFNILRDMNFPLSLFKFYKWGERWKPRPGLFLGKFILKFSTKWINKGTFCLVQHLKRASSL